MCNQRGIYDTVKYVQWTFFTERFLVVKYFRKKASA